MKRSHLTQSSGTRRGGPASGLRWILLASALIVLILPASAYAYQTDQARALIDKANAKMDQQTKVDTRVGKLLNRALQVKSTATALSLLADVKAGCATLTDNVESQAALYTEVAGLDVSPELKTFALQREAIAQRYVRAYGLLAQLAAKYEATAKWGSLSGAERKALRRDIAAIGVKLQKEWAQIQSDHQASVQYFNDQKLADQLTVAEQPLASPTLPAGGLSLGMLIGVGVAGLIISVSCAVACGIIARRKQRSAAGWAVLGLFFPLIALILILVLPGRTAGTVGPPPAPAASV
jgi:hypothetical protein